VETECDDVDRSDREERYDSPADDWPRLVARIKAGDEDATADLYQIFARGIRFHLCRQLGPQELEDRVHDTFLIVMQAIRRGELREPERLMGFIRTIVRRQVSVYIDAAVHRRKEHVELEAGVLMTDRNNTPEESVIRQQRREILTSILSRMGNRDREILTRFYLHEEPQEQICREMSLSETQFRLLKSRAKARFGELGKKKVQKPPSSPPRYGRPFAGDAPF
jgi:RNA polymerase sigma-70 factor (ECF subfamily)